MPVSHPYRCLFVHIPKTGGTSIEKALGIHGSDSLEQTDILFGPIRSWRLRLKRPGTKYLQHLTCSEIEKIAPGIIAADYFSFAFVRNPWDRMVSVYSSPDGNMVRGARKNGLELKGLSFREFVEKTQDLFHAHLRPQSEFVCGTDGRLQVDFVGRFERLEEDFAKVCNRLGMDVELPWHNRSKRRSIEGYREYYCARTRDMVAEKYRRDVALFGYRF